MITIRHILCPTDFSEFSRRGLTYAIALAKWYDADLVALHVHPFQAAPATKLPTYAGPPHLTPRDRELLLEELKEFTAPARSASVPVQNVVVEGDPVAEILKRAREADLLVLGTHGRSGFERLMLGSVTEKVLRKSTCPVLTVPRQAFGAGPDEAAVFKHILCPIDFSKASLRSLEYALSLAKEADGRLTLIHALDSLPEEAPPETLKFDVLGYADYLRRVAGDRLLRLIPEGAREWCRPEVVVAPGKAYRGILKTAEERRADLIVMGVVGRGSIDLLLFGSTTEQVVRQATCPVLSIRAH
jgi:nucleotide-binding universal stress UspA family protein